MSPARQRPLTHPKQICMHLIGNGQVMMDSPLQFAMRRLQNVATYTEAPSCIYVFEKFFCFSTQVGRARSTAVNRIRFIITAVGILYHQYLSDISIRAAESRR